MIILPFFLYILHSEVKRAGLLEYVLNICVCLYNNTHHTKNTTSTSLRLMFQSRKKTIGKHTYFETEHQFIKKGNLRDVIFIL